MTQDEILAMEAGRGIDALIATHILGLAWWRRGQSGQWIALCPHDTEIPDYWIRDVPPIDIGEDDLSEAVPCYSTDIAAAWDVVYKMIAMGHSISIADNDGRYWGVDFYRMRDEAAFDALSTANALSPELAICRAALLAVMEAES